MKLPFVLRSTHDQKVKSLEANERVLRQERAGLIGEVDKWEQSSREFKGKYIDCKVDYHNTHLELIALGHEKGHLESVNSSLESKVKSLEHGFAIERSELLGTLMVKDEEISQLVSKVSRLQKYSSELVKAGMQLEKDLAAARAPKTRKKKTAA